MEDSFLMKDMFIMCSEPSPDLTIEDVKQFMDEIETELELATLFAVVRNKACWIADEEYDFEEGTEAYEKAREKTDLWFAYAERLKQKIFAILRAEEVEIPDKGQIVVLKPFMERNGFMDGNGWWVKA